MDIIQVEGISKKFGSLVAVDKVSFCVEEGEIFGFLGPNGAGKTTTINMLCTLLAPTEGKARVNGYNIVRGQRMTGMTSDVPLLLPVLTGFPGDIRLVHEGMADSTKFRVVHGIIEHSIRSNTNNDESNKCHSNGYEYCRKRFFLEKSQVSY